MRQRRKNVALESVLAHEPSGEESRQGREKECKHTALVSNPRTLWPAPPGAEELNVSLGIVQRATDDNALHALRNGLLSQGELWLGDACPALPQPWHVMRAGLGQVQRLFCSCGGAEWRTRQARVSPVRVVRQGGGRCAMHSCVRRRTSPRCPRRSGHCSALSRTEVPGGRPLHHRRSRIPQKTPADSGGTAARACHRKPHTASAPRGATCQRSGLHRRAVRT